MASPELTLRLPSYAYPKRCRRESAWYGHFFPWSLVLLPVFSPATRAPNCFQQKRGENSPTGFVGAGFRIPQQQSPTPGGVLKFNKKNELQIDHYGQKRLHLTNVRQVDNHLCSLPHLAFVLQLKDLRGNTFLFLWRLNL